MNMITEDYVSFEVAKLLKNKGFDEVCKYEYGVPDADKGYVLQEFCQPIQNCELIDTAYTAPTLQMAMKWLREVHKIFIEVGYNRFYGTYNVHVFNMVEQQDDPYKLPARFNNYEEACETTIKYCLENLI